MIVKRAKLLREFIDKYPDAEKPVSACYKILSSGNWQSFNDLSRTFPRLENMRGDTVFCINKGNYFIVTYIDYEVQLVRIRKVLTQVEYGIYQQPENLRGTLGSFSSSSNHF